MKIKLSADAAMLSMRKKECMDVSCIEKINHRCYFIFQERLNVSKSFGTVVLLFPVPAGCRLC